ncbi:MAG: M67 family metallopeptidase [Candidatus Acidiferrales bacterium]
MLRQIHVRGDALHKIRDLAETKPEAECCGLLAGRDGVITDVFPAVNMAPDPVKGYEIAPKEIVGMMREFRERKLEFIGIYHSHPNGKNEPSARDIELAYYSEAIYFIISPMADAPKPVRAFSIRDGRVTELEIEIQ